MKMKVPKARRSFFALETRNSNTLLQDAQEGLPLESYSDSFTNLHRRFDGKRGRDRTAFGNAAGIPHRRRQDDLSAIAISEFETDEMDFRLYKVLAAHGAGQIEFGTYVRDTPRLKAAYAELSALYEATADQTDAFSLAGYIEDVQKGEKALSPEEASET